MEHGLAAVAARTDGGCGRQVKRGRGAEREGGGRKERGIGRGQNRMSMKQAKRASLFRSISVFAVRRGGAGACWRRRARTPMRAPFGWTTANVQHERDTERRRTAQQANAYVS